MDIEYLPNNGFTINAIKMEWNNERNSVRERLGNKHKDDDKIINVAEFFDGDEGMNIHQKRDIYENLYSKNDSLFLNYDQNNLLTELEVHDGFEILVNGIRLEFGKEITDFIEQFKDKKIELLETESGNYFLPKLKLTIANSESLGGDGTALRYFYGAMDISHLME